jgi:type II secretory pathway predicted ATPase ExeA
VYYEYWGLAKAPFDNVPDPTMYVDSHASVENAIAETLFAIEEGNECVSVIVGDVGSGKSLSLRLILDSLDHEKYRIALITNPDISFVQLLQEIIGQLTGRVCDSKHRMELLETFNKLLFSTMDEGKKVVVFIDEANAMSGPNLESLRLLTNMQSDDQNLFTIVLAGQLELARKLEHPRRANLFQRIGAYCRIEKIESIAILKDYMQTRLRLAGGTRMLFTDGAVQAVWDASEEGVPRLVNKVCKLSLKAGETNGLQTIDESVVRQIGDRFHRFATTTTAPAPKRQRTPEAQQRVTVSQQRASDAQQRAPQPRQSMPEPQQRPAEVQPRMPEPQQKVVEPLQRVPEPARTECSIHPFPKEVQPPREAQPAQPQPAEHRETPIGQAAAVQEPPPADVASSAQGRFSGPSAEAEAGAGPLHIKISIPSDILEQAQSYTHETRARVAGMLAAQTLQKYPHLAVSQSPDPVSVWCDIKASIMNVLEERAQAMAQ